MGIVWEGFCQGSGERGALYWGFAEVATLNELPYHRKSPFARWARTGRGTKSRLCTSSSLKLNDELTTHGKTPRIPTLDERCPRYSIAKALGTGT